MYILLIHEIFIGIKQLNYGRSYGKKNKKGIGWVVEVAINMLEDIQRSFLFWLILDILVINL